MVDGGVAAGRDYLLEDVMWVRDLRVDEGPPIKQTVFILQTFWSGKLDKM